LIPIGRVSGTCKEWVVPAPELSARLYGLLASRSTSRCW
jgi:hypothetical protein